MSRHLHHRRMLWCAATDRTWRRVERNGARWLVGKCIHCTKQISMALDGTPGGTTTLEHIVPRTHGGTHAPDNLTLACGRCNGQKGVRLDSRPLDDPALQQVIATLRARREARLRPPPPGWVMPPRPPDTLAADGTDDDETSDEAAHMTAPSRPRRGRKRRRRR